MASQNDSSVDHELPCSSGISTTDELAPTQLYYQSSDPLAAEFRQSVTMQIARQLNEEDKANICHLYRYDVGPETRNVMGINLLEKLEKAGVFHARNITRLEKLLKDINRCDLYNMYLKPYCKKHAGELIKQEDSQPIDESAEIPRKKPRLNDSVEEFDISDIDRECKNASVHGVIVDVSPIHSTKRYQARRYFSADVTDGKETMRFVCFNPAMRRTVERMRQRKTPCTIKNCTIKCSTYPPTAGDFEFFNTAETKVVANPRKKYEISDEQIYTSSRVLEQLSDLEDTIKGQSVTVQGKISKMTDPDDVLQSSSRFKLQKQECTLADKGMSVSLKIWEEDIGKVHTEKSYRFIKVKVRQYDGEKFLTTTEDSTFEEIDDIGEVTTKITLPNTQKVIRGRIAAVARVLKYKACPSCNSKVDPTSAECSKCNSSVNLSLCSDQVLRLAKFTVQDESAVSHEVTAFTEVISQLIGPHQKVLSLLEPQIKRLLLRSQDLTLFKINEDVVVSVGQ